MSNELIEQVKNAKKETKVKVYLQTERQSEFPFPVYDKVVLADFDEVVPYLGKSGIVHAAIETISRKSALGLQDVLEMNARIEPGALIRKGAEIGQDTVVLMGAVINTGAKIGAQTMVDMNAVVGSGAQIQERCHIGAGAVIAGMMEPCGMQGVVIEHDVLIGANAVILEEVRVGHHSIVGAGAVVTKDVEPYSVMIGVPARKIKENRKESLIESELRDGCDD